MEVQNFNEMFQTPVSELKGEINQNTIIVGDLTTSSTAINQTKNK